MDLIEHREAMLAAGWRVEALDVLDAVIDELALAQVDLIHNNPTSVPAVTSYLTGRVTNRMYQVYDGVITQALADSRPDAS